VAGRANNFADIRKTLALSVLAHLLLLLAFLMISVGLEFNPAEFAEISFVSGTAGASTAPAAQIEPEQRSAPSATPAGTEQLPKEKPQEEPVNLPMRRMAEEEEPKIVHREAGKISPQMETGKPLIRPDALDSYESSRATAGPATGEKLPAGSEKLPVGDKDLAASEEKGNSTESLPYSIEGEATQRRVLDLVIPQYPAGLQREAVVRIRFTVLPDGYIGQMIPVQKGDPTLEEITLDALRKWRFNSLPANVEQKNVQGIITFRYELK
jgi:TonB family protein